MYETKLLHYSDNYIHCFDGGELDNEWWAAMVSTFDRGAGLDADGADDWPHMDDDIYMRDDLGVDRIQ